jgi:hypothetical protein
VLADALILAGLGLSVEAARRVFTVDPELLAAAAAKRPVLFCNAKSGGGKAERFHGGCGRWRRDAGDRRWDRGGAGVPVCLGAGGDSQRFRARSRVDRDDVVGALDAFA